MAKRTVLLAKLAESEGKSVDEMLKAASIDSVVPAICTKCDVITEMEPDQASGFCEECHTNTVCSCLVLAGLI